MAQVANGQADEDDNAGRVAVLAANDCIVNDHIDDVARISSKSNATANAAGLTAEAAAVHDSIAEAAYCSAKANLSKRSCACAKIAIANDCNLDIGDACAANAVVSDSVAETVGASGNSVVIIDDAGDDAGDSQGPLAAMEAIVELEVVIDHFGKAAAVVNAIDASPTASFCSSVDFPLSTADAELSRSKSTKRFKRARALIRSSASKLITLLRDTSSVAFLTLPGQYDDRIKASEDSYPYHPDPVEVPDDEGMHERWDALLRGRSAAEVPESELSWILDSGTPMKHRHSLWPRWWGNASAAEYANIDQLDVPPDALLDIERDVGRTLWRLLASEQRDSLRRVLRAYASRHPKIGYCQGMSFIAAVPLLLGFSEANSLAALSYIIKNVCPGYFEKGLQGYFCDVAVIDTMIGCLLPNIAIELEALQIRLHMLATDHLMTLSACHWPLNAVVRLWDVVLMGGSARLLATFLALLEIYLPVALEGAKEACSCGKADPCGLSVDVVLRFQALQKEGVSRDIDEVIARSRYYLPLVSGKADIGTAERGGGEFLEWLRLEFAAGSLSDPHRPIVE